MRTTGPTSGWATWCSAASNLVTGVCVCCTVVYFYIFVFCLCFVFSCCVLSVILCMSMFCCSVLVCSLSFLLLLISLHLILPHLPVTPLSSLRCAFTSVDPETGEKCADQEPLATLKRSVTVCMCVLFCSICISSCSFCICFVPFVFLFLLWLYSFIHSLLFPPVIFFPFAFLTL